MNVLQTNTNAVKVVPTLLEVTHAHAYQRLDLTATGSPVTVRYKI